MIEIVYFNIAGLEVLAFNVAIEAHKRKIIEAILEYALKICFEKNVNIHIS